MSGIQIQFKPWAPFHAEKNKNLVHKWLDDIGKASVDAFRNGMSKHYPPASAPGAWPANRTGSLRESIDHEVSGDVLTVGTGMRYSVFLRYGTSRMARRKMSDDALREGMKVAGRQMGHWVRWTRS